MANGVASLQVGNQAAVVSGLYEVMAASILYIALPKEIGGKLVGLFSSGDDHSRSDGLRRSVIMKLDYAAKALGAYPNPWKKSAGSWARPAHRTSMAYTKKAIDEICMGCGLKVYCWERNYGDSMNAFNDLTSRLRTRGRIDRSDFSPHFATHCSRLNDMVECVNRNYEHLVRQAAEGRVAGTEHGCKSIYNDQPDVGGYG